MLNLDNVLSPQILFFALGFFARLIRSDLSLPENFGKLISVYLLIAIGLHGGGEIKNSNLMDSFLAVMIAIFLGFTTPLLAYLILKKLLKVDGYNSSAIAAHYGSVSISTFIIATGYLKSLNIKYDGYPVIMLAIMESPAIIVGLILSEFARFNKYSISTDLIKNKLPSILFNSLKNGCVLLLFGSIFIGYLISKENLSILSPLFKDNFSGILCLFLLALGMEAAENFSDLKIVGIRLFFFAILFPILSFVLGASISKISGFNFGTSFLVGILASSASYIAVPPAMKIGIPEANPAFYLTMSIGVTFTFNVIIGVHIYLYILKEIF